MKEIWKKCKNYNNYEVSNTGKVRNKKGIILIGEINLAGYHVVNLRVNGKSKLVRVHRLVAQAFIPNPLNKPCVNHKDYVRTNNYIENLEWVTYKENNLWSSQHLSEGHKGQVAWNKGKKMSEEYKNKCKERTKYYPMPKNNRKVSQYDLNGNFIKTYNSLFEAQKETDSDFRLISAVCYRKRKTHNGFIWKFEN